MLQQVPTGIDCANLYSTGQRVSGLYSIRPVSGPGFNVYCDMETDGGGWTVVQRRTNGELDFDRNWDDYRAGFGTDAAKCDGEFWLGNEHLVRLTSNNFLTVRFEIMDWQDQTRVAEYYYFRVNNDRKFTVQISQYQETKSNLTDSITGWGYPEAHRKNPNNMKFTTRDNDNDLNETGNCAHLYAGRHGSGGWWYNSCMAANINGHYYHGGAYNREGILDGDGIMWPTWAGISYSMKATEMKVRPHDFSQKFATDLVHSQNTEESIQCDSERWGELCPNECLLQSMNEDIVATAMEQFQQLDQRVTDVNEQCKSLEREVASYDRLKANLTNAIHRRIENLYQAVNATMEEIRVSQTVSEEISVNANQVIADLKVVHDQLTNIHINLSEWYDRCGIGDDTLLMQECKLPVVTGRDCADIHRKGGRESGVYLIKPDISPTPLRVYCDMDDAGGGWTVIQRRFDGTLDFSRTWQEYKQGFGQWGCDFVDEFWLGNEYIYALTAQDKQQLKVDLVSWQNESRYAWYSYFKLGDEASRYRLRYIENYRRHPVQNIGDAFRGHSTTDSAEGREQTDHKSMQFTTKDKDNDNYAANCAAGDSGGWWFNRCSAANLNAKWYEGGIHTPEESSTGYYDDGILWATWKGRWETLKETSMKIRPLGFDSSQTRH
ncbi:fibrinogen gamma chain-like [Ciona intestinalis]